MNLERTFLGWQPRQLASEGPRYLALVYALEQDISDGHLSDGDRLPPHRELAQRLSLSVGTVAKAYQEAEQRGIISGRVGQGTFVRRRAMSRPDGAAPREPVNMALNVPAHGRETEVLSGLFSELSRNRDLAQLLDYHPHGGIREHREIIAASVSSGSFTIDPARLLLCNGAQHALDIAIRLVASPGDSILVDSLTYSGFKAIAAANHLTLIPIAMDGEGVDPDGLEAACRSSGAKVFYCMPTLQSPTARTMSLQRRRRIAELADKLDLTVIEDDVYGFFVPERPVSLTELIPDRSFYVTSYSKCVAPGFRLGTLTLPSAYTQQAELLLHASSWFVAPILSEMAVRLIENGQLDELVRERRHQAKERYRMFSDIFPTVEPLEYPPFYGWLPLPSEWSASSFASAARRKNILVTPPVASSVDETDPGAIRVCLGGLKDLNDLSDALYTLNEVITRPPPNVFSFA
ncbi:PLP-dependent aminotransferase family protein [Neorhizobium galegae]|uniref:aminotransferase-like domain-containing protein n=1 Tax=Neorhizobium galegae TaxID=399 RepID=UPI0006215558|nr:PLP-dependent aminotransferase family protein [Neorhizobium galegae]CDZ30835.1 Transcriptional regulator with HTH domain and aminotransferase domain [Neorhizobium galegae bv. officinalis]KAA9382311.1 PLP-dependent aminotransferase family protein [Neorhizobium galegae]KAB1110806.1 PLP-dependent aminotransferase family protein [Neorhizobium galegae]MCQ1769626.1 PLP-dependent aminotransferase family protein [Neorhizobium galegae]MCQ1775186.1 PLP-dependent aminotransferase family protein [Neorh